MTDMIRQVQTTNHMVYGITGMGDNGGDAWVQYDWESEVTIYQSDAYYFTDGNFVPKSVSYQYKDANGNWRDLPNAVRLWYRTEQI